MPRSVSARNKQNICTREIIYRHGRKNSFVESSPGYSFLQFTNSSGAGSTILQDKNVEQIFNYLSNVTNSIENRTRNNRNSIKYAIKQLNIKQMKKQPLKDIKCCQSEKQSMKIRRNVKYLNLKDILKQNEDLAKQPFSFKRQNTMAQLDEAQQNNKHFEIDENLNFIRNNSVQYEQVPTFVSNQFEIGFQKKIPSDVLGQLNDWQNKENIKTQRKSMCIKRVQRKLSADTITERFSSLPKNPYQKIVIPDKRKVMKKNSYKGIYEEILSLYSTAKLLAMSNR